MAKLTVNEEFLIACTADDILNINYDINNNNILTYS